MPMPPTRRNTAHLLIMALALGLIALALFALACGPSAPAGQDADPTPEPTATAEPANTPTPTLSIDCDAPEHESNADCWGPPPTLTPLERQYPHLEEHLIDKIAEYEATSEAQGASGSSDQPTPTPELIDVIIFLDTADRTDEIQRFLEDNSVPHINCVKGRSDSLVKGSCGATLPVSLLRSLADQTGVLRIDKQYLQQPASNLGAPSSQQTPAEAHGVMAWRLAGADGSSVKVGIIDYGFKDFRTRLPNLTPAAKPFCYNSNGVLSKTDLAGCESNIGPHPSDDHGTEVAEALIEIAPNASLYIANANTLPRVKAAVDWMDENDVDVINYSLAGVWDGPGDGTSPFDMLGTNEYSTLNSLDDAVDADMLWVSAAGNDARNIWFKRGVSLTSARYVDFDPGPNAISCNNLTVNLQSGQAYTFHVRWEGVWSNEDSDITLHLYRISPSPGWIGRSRGVQDGGAMQFPREVLNYTRTDAGAGEYCLVLHLANGDSVPAWVQLWADGLPLQYTTGRGSIMNPAESANPEMLAVGAADYNPMAIKDFSGRGPAPEPAPNAANPPGRIKPDIVGANQGAVIGTSYSAPRVAGLAAMVVQSLTNPLGTRPAPTRVVGYLKQHAQPRSESVLPGTPTPTPGRNNTWGHGFAKLPPPPPPTGLALRVDRSNPNDILLDYTNSSWAASSAHRYHLVLERWVNGQWQTFAFNSRVSASPARFSGLTPGYWYRAKGARCVVSTTVSCGEWSGWSGSRYASPAAALSPIPSTVSFTSDGAWHEFSVNANVPVKIIANPTGSTSRVEIHTSNTANHCPAEPDDYRTRRNGQSIYLAGCVGGAGTVEIRRSSNSALLRAYTFTISVPQAQQCLPVSGFSAARTLLGNVRASWTNPSGGLTVSQRKVAVSKWVNGAWTAQSPLTVSSSSTGAYHIAADHNSYYTYQVRSECSGGQNSSWSNWVVVGPFGASSREAPKGSDPTPTPTPVGGSAPEGGVTEELPPNPVR